jgi:hypothetical protein
MPAAEGVPLIVIVFAAHAADTPEGNPVAAPMPVAPVVVCVIEGSAVLIHNVGVDEAVLTVLVGLTVTAKVTLLQPVANDVYVKRVTPAPIPVTIPDEVTVATDGSPLSHIPPVVGDRVVVAPIHIKLLPVILTTGNALTVTAVVVLLQLVAEEVKVNVADPGVTPVTTPADVTVATEGLLLTHVPPVVGDR